MFWDIALSVLAAVAQAVTGFLGWRVTVDGVRPKRKIIYERLFAVASLVGIVSVGIAAYRSSQIGDDLAELRKGQTQTNNGIKEIKENPPVVNVNPQITVPNPPQPIPSAHVVLDRYESSYATGLPTIPIAALLEIDKPVSINFYFKNIGNADAQRLKFAGQVAIATTETEEQIIRDYNSALNKERKNKNIMSKVEYATLQPGGVNQESWFTVQSKRPITADDIAKLRIQEERLYLIVVAEYVDPSGPHHIHMCQMLQPLGVSPTSTEAIWHFCKTFNDSN